MYSIKHFNNDLLRKIEKKEKIKSKSYKWFDLDTHGSIMNIDCLLFSLSDMNYTVRI